MATVKKRTKNEVFHLADRMTETYLALMCVWFRVAAIGLLLTYGNDARSQFPYSLHAFPPVTGTYSENQADVNSFRGNAASLARLPFSGLSFYGERPYLIKNLSGFYLNSSVRNGDGGFGLGLHYQGGNYLNQAELSVAYGRPLAASLDIGAEIHYQVLNQAGYTKKNFSGFEIGLLLHPASKFIAGIKIRDPQGYLSDNKQEKLPSVLVLGLGYEASSQFLFTIEVSREENTSIEASARMQYRPHPSIRFRSGMALKTHTAWFTAGFAHRNLFIDIGAIYHSYLGLTPGIQVSIHFPAKKK